MKQLSSYRSAKEHWITWLRTSNFKSDGSDRGFSSRVPNCRNLLATTIRSPLRAEMKALYRLGYHRQRRSHRRGTHGSGSSATGTGHRAYESLLEPPNSARADGQNSRNQRRQFRQDDLNPRSSLDPPGIVPRCQGKAAVLFNPESLVTALCRS